MRTNAIVAVCRGNGIGIKNRIPWRLKNEMNYFNRMTSTTVDPGKVNAVVMGRKTWESIPPKYAPLAGRFNVILSNSLSSVPEKADLLCSSLKSAITSLKTNPKIESIWIIGGSAIYQEAIEKKMCDRVYITRIDAQFDCDTYFPEVDFTKFNEIEDDQVPKGVQEENGLEYRFHVYELVDK